MTTFRIIAYHSRSGERDHSFVLKGDSIEEVMDRFSKGHPAMIIQSVKPIEPIETIEIDSKPHTYTLARERAHHKARLCQIREDIQSLTDSEECVLTVEEILSLQRISCKLDRIAALFSTRTMDLKKAGKL